MMSEEQFRQLVREKGYEEGQFKEYPPNTDGPMHTHDFSVMLIVVGGEVVGGARGSILE